METVALPSAGEMHARAGAGVERRDLRLGGDGFEREERMLRRDRHDHLRRIDLFRRSKIPELDPEEEMILPSGVEAPDARIEAMETEARVRAAMKDLPEEQVLLLKLAFYEGLSHSEIAARLGAPLGTVKSRIRLAFAKMKVRLGDE